MEQKTAILITETEWDAIRERIAVRELRTRGRMRVAQIAVALRMTEDEVRDRLREPGRTSEHMSDTLTVSATIRQKAGMFGGSYRPGEVLLKAWRHESIYGWMQEHLPALFRTCGTDGKVQERPASSSDSD